MLAYRQHTSLCMLAFLLLTACASAPSQTADEPEVVRVNVNSTLALHRSQRDESDLFDGDFSVALDSDLLRYEASYELDRGDVFLSAMPDSAAKPQRLGSQQFDQNIRLRLPELAGAPISLGVSSQTGSNLLLSGYSQTQQEYADLDWSPGPARVDISWTAAGMPYDASAALECNLKSTVRLPTHEGVNHSEGLVLSGAACAVAADNTAYADLATQAFGLGYEWTRPDHKSAAVLSVIDPVRMHADESRAVAPGYELDMSHQRDFGLLSAQTVISWRQPPAWDGAPGLDEAYVHDPAGGPGWTTNTSLTWELADLSLSANWATGVDPLWFTPDLGAPGDRFGLALDLSRWMEGLVPRASPKLAMNWNWSQVRMAGAAITTNNALRVDLTLMF